MRPLRTLPGAPLHQLRSPSVHEASRDQPDSSATPSCTQSVPLSMVPTPSRLWPDPHPHPCLGPPVVSVPGAPHQPPGTTAVRSPDFPVQQPPSNGSPNMEPQILTVAGGPLGSATHYPSPWPHRPYNTPDAMGWALQVLLQEGPFPGPCPWPPRALPRWHVL